MGDFPVCRTAHTPCPEDYIGWHSWAEKMSKTHEQRRCHGCGIYAIWVKRVDSKKVLFLDIDGVLNAHFFDVDAQSSHIKPKCVERLNRVLKATRCALVISSAWRYMILGGARP